MTEMSKEDMVKEAVEEAKAKAAQEDDSDQEETAQAEENTEAAAEEAEDQKETPETENDGSGDAENGEPKEEKKKFFGKKNKKDKKDEKIEELTDRLSDGGVRQLPQTYGKGEVPDVRDRREGHY